MSATSSWPTCWLWPGPARFPRSAPCALLVELASLGAYVVVLRGKFTLAVSLDGRLFPMLCEALLMLAGLAFAVLSLARRLAFPQKSRE